MTIEWLGQTAAAAVISCIFSTLIFGALRRYLDERAEEEETRRHEREKLRKERSIAEAQRRHAAGRLLYWIYRAITKPPANGELEDAMKIYNEAETAQKALEQEIIAELDSERRG